MKKSYGIYVGEYIHNFAKNRQRNGDSIMMEATEVCNLLMGMFQIQHRDWILSSQKITKEFIKNKQNQIKFII